MILIIIVAAVLAACWQERKEFRRLWRELSD
jgi:hypothetical protein